MTAPPDGGSTALGVLTPDSARTILVIGDDGDLAVALRERVERSYALVKDVRRDEALEGFDTCIPWPWLVVGSVSTLPADVVPAVVHHPILVFWRGDVPDGMPSHTRTFAKFGELAEAVNEAMNQVVAGMKLSIGLGVDLPDGSYARSAELQALVSCHPHPLDVPLDAFRSAARVLATHNIPWKPARDGETGGVTLIEASGVAS